MEELKEGRWEGEMFLLNDKKFIIAPHLFTLHFEE